MPPQKKERAKEDKKNEKKMGTAAQAGAAAAGGGAGAEVKKPVENMCLKDLEVSTAHATPAQFYSWRKQFAVYLVHSSYFVCVLKAPIYNMMSLLLQELPELDRIPGILLPGQAFADCLTVLDFIQNFGDSLGLSTSAFADMSYYQLYMYMYI